MPRFYVGQPVVCIDDRSNKWLRGVPGITWVTRGARYHIRGNHCAKMKSGVMNFVTLREIRNPIVMWSDNTLREASFWEERFEPATDISTLEEELMNADMFVGNEIEIANPAPARKKEKVE